MISSTKVKNIIAKQQKKYKEKDVDWKTIKSQVSRKKQLFCQKKTLQGTVRVRVGQII